jgi:hypothetical protein
MDQAIQAIAAGIAHPVSQSKNFAGPIPRYRQQPYFD